MNFSRNVKFYQLLLGSSLRNKIYACVYLPFVMGGMIFRSPTLGLLNLVILGLIFSSRFDQLHRIPAGLMVPRYRFEQIITGLLLLGLFGGIPLLSTANSYEQFLFLVGLGLTISSALLVSTYCIGGNWVMIVSMLLFFQLPTSGVSIFDLKLDPMTPFYSSLAIVLYVYLRVRKRQLKPGFSQWLDMRFGTIRMQNWYGSWSLTIPSTRYAFLQLVAGMANPVVYLSILVQFVLVIEVWVFFETNIVGMYYFLPMIIFTQLRLQLSFSDLDRLWLASKFTSKTTFLIAISVFVTTSMLFLSTALLVYSSLRFDPDLLQTLPVFLKGFALSLFLVCFYLCPWRLVLAAFLLPFGLSLLFLDGVWIVLVAALCWFMCVYYYAYYLPKENGRLVEPFSLFS